jgi:hypothetical protein
MLFIIFATALVATWTYGSYHQPKTAVEMATAAKNFLAALTTEQRTKASIKFEDQERIRWHYIPESMWPRKGIPFKDLDAAQRQLAHAFLSTGLSHRGYLKATTIMSLEAVLKELESKGPVRDADSIFSILVNLRNQTWDGEWKVTTFPNFTSSADS